VSSAVIGLCLPPDGHRYLQVDERPRDLRRPTLGALTAVGCVATTLPYPSSIVRASNAVDALRSSLAALTETRAQPSSAELSMLRRRVCAVVDVLKADEMAAERVVMAVKHVAIESGIQWTHNRIVDRLIDWCLDRYYERPPTA
jgi:hypothetical protein